MKKRFHPKYIKRGHQRRSGVAQTGAHGTSHRIAPPDAHRLGNLPQAWPRTGQTGQYTASIMGRMGDGSLTHYTDEDKEDFKKMDGPPGKAGNYKTSATRVYIKKGGGKPMIGATSVSEAKEQSMEEQALRELIREMIQQEITEARKRKMPADVAAFSVELMDEDEEEDDADRADMDEFSGSAAVAGFSLPLGASNHPSTLKSRGDFTAKMYGGRRIKLNARTLARREE
jgi:hypothetical protein|tara:strand:+ start:1946 stop:2632 length:687 start_codon:yes stop_codon:yes gene_type:complete